MIPAFGEDMELDLIEDDYQEPSLTYKMNTKIQKIVGLTDGLEAVKQAIFKILSTERYEYPIYSWNYGIELKELYGKPMSYVLPELQRVITEALETDDRIDSVDEFEFDVNGRSVHVAFSVHTIFGNLENEEVEVDI